MNIKTDFVKPASYGGQLANPRFIILHATAGSTYAGARAAYDERGVSAHYTVNQAGQIYQNVPIDRVAYHAGESRWGTVENLNTASYGIEMVGLNLPNSMYPAKQVQAVKELCLFLCERSGIFWWNILTHAMISPNRKTDPANFSAYGEVLKHVAESSVEKPTRVILNGQEWPVNKLTIVGDKVYINR